MENNNQEAKVVEATTEDVVTTAAEQIPPAEQTTSAEQTPPADQTTASDQTAPAEDKPKKGRGRPPKAKTEKAPKEKKPPKPKKPPKEKKPPKPKKPKASEMTLEELAETELVHAKITVSEDQKEEYAPLLGFVGQRFSSRRELQEAGLEIAIMYYTETEKGKGIIQRVEGQITMFDPTTQVIGIDGNKYKLNCTYTIEALNFDPFDEDAVFEPQRQDEDDDEDEEDRYSDDDDDDDEDSYYSDRSESHRSDDHDDDQDDYYGNSGSRHDRDRSGSYSPNGKYYYVEDEDGFTHRLTAAQYKEMERIQEAMRKQMERDMERMREQQRRDFARKHGGSIDDDGYFADDDDGYYADADSGYWPDERPPRQKSDDESSGSSSKKSRGPKTIGWLPPEKRKLEMHDKKKKGAKKEEG